MDSERSSSHRTRIYSPEEQQIVVNVYKYVKKTWPECRGSITECSTKTAEITGLMKHAVYRILRDRRARRRPIHEIVDPISLMGIRRKIYRFYHEAGYGVPRPENILCDVNADPTLPNYTMPVFRRVLEHLQYRHVVTQNRNNANSRSETFSIPVV